MIGFYMKWNTGLKWVKIIRLNLFRAPASYMSSFAVDYLINTNISSFLHIACFHGLIRYLT